MSHAAVTAELPAASAALERVDQAYSDPGVVVQPSRAWEF